MAKKIYTNAERKAQFIKTGIKLARKLGLSKLSVSAVATEHEVTAPLIFHIFGTRDKFRSAVKSAAKKQGIALDEPKTAAAPRKRSIKEVRAIKNKLTVGNSGIPKGAKVTATRKTKAKAAPAKKVARVRKPTAVSASPSSSPASKGKVSRPRTPRPKASASDTSAAKGFATLPVPASEANGVSLSPKV